MKVLPFIFYLVLSAFIIQGCHRKGDLEEQRLTWTTESPLSIPLRIRLQRFEKENLVRNPSFESGKIFKLDSATASFVIDGWHQTGHRVEWVDTRMDSLYLYDEAMSGTRAVKIVRKQAAETDEKGDGILSEFIKTIPGNYGFSFYAKLENIVPLRARLGTRMYDAIDIRLLFFDKNKNALSGKQVFPQLDQNIDNTFKSLSLANFITIKSFPWGKIIGKSSVFPYPEGDIPTNAHYLKIFIGLKGTGTMWIDSVDLRYTVKNFSVAERMRVFADTGYVTDQIIIPTPKMVHKMGSVDYHSQTPIILIPENANENLLQAARLVKDKISEGLARVANTTGDISMPQIVNSFPVEGIPESRLIFSIGKTVLYGKYRDKLPEKEIAGRFKGYYVYSFSDLPRLVFMDGSSDEALYYAALTVEQLFDNKRPVFHNCRIIDFPDFENRFYSLGTMTDDSSLKGQGSISRSLRKYKLTGGIQIPGLLYPENVTLSFIYPVRFDNNASAMPVPGLSVYYPEGSTVFSHPVYSNQLLDYSNYNERMIRPGKPMLYSGSSFFSVNTDDADILRFTMFSGSKPVCMDNSMLISSEWGQYGGSYPYYPGKIRMYNVFEPFMNTEIKYHYGKYDQSMMFVNFSAYNEIDIIRLATAADFMWNTKKYIPEFSLWKVLFSRYGASAARELVQYGDKIGLLYEILLKVQLNEQMARNLKNAQTNYSELIILTNSIEKMLGPQHLLMEDINHLNFRIKKRIDGFIAASVKSSGKL